MEKIKRHRYLVDKGVQLRYMALVLFPLVLLLSGLYYLIYYSVFTQMLIPEAVAVTLVPAMKKVNIVMAAAIPVALFIILRRALIYSNRIVGAIPRLERELDKAIAGDYSIRMKIRDKDELVGFINKINALLDKLQKSQAA